MTQERVPFVEAIRPTDLRDLREVAYRHLRKVIVEGKLPGGTRINEREVAAMLGISTTPVKDALRRLEAEGSIVTLPRRGSFVAHFTSELRHEFTLVRAALEGVAARLAAERAHRTGSVSDISAALSDMRSRTEAGDAPGLAMANERFHDEIRRLAGSEYLARLLESLRVYDQTSRHEILADESERRMALAEHEMVAAAILDGKAEAAEQTMRAHVLRSSTVLAPSNAGSNESERS